MSQSNCPSDSDIYAGVNRPQGLGDSSAVVAPPVNPVLDQATAQFRQEQEQAAKQQLLDRAASAISPDMLPQSATTLQQKSQLSSLSRELQGWVRDATAGVERRQQALNDALNAVSGATVHDASVWLNITNGIAKRFLKKEADWDKWAILNVGTSGNSVKDNPLVRAQENMVAVTAGLSQKYRKDLLTNVHAPAKPFADRAHMDVSDFMRAVGEYAVMRHIPEANAELLRTWNTDMVIAQARKNIPEVQRLQKQIAELRQNLNSTNPDKRLISAGYTDAQANAMRGKLLASLGLTEAEAGMLSDNLLSLKRRIDDDRRAAGTIPPEVQASWPEFQYYVPLKSKVENTTGAPNVANIYNPGRYYERQGGYNPPASAYDTIAQYGRRAAFEIGMQDLGTTMIAAMQHAEETGRDIGLLSIPYSKVIQAQHSNNEFARRYADRLLNDETGGGIVVDMPIEDANGNVTTRKHLITFNQEWRDESSGLTGVQLNQALMGSVKMVPGFSTLAKATSIYGQLNTRFNPAFAAPNSIRDIFERVTHMAARDYRDSSGNIISGASLTGQFLTGLPATMRTLLAWKRGTLDMNSRDGQLMQSYVESGLHQEFTWGQNTPRLSLEEVISGQKSQASSAIGRQLDDHGMRGVRESLGRFDTATRGRVLGVLDNWNDFFNNIASFNHYKTLMNNGVEARTAAHGVLEMMDLYQKGTLTPMLSTLFPYVKPTVQSAKALSRTLGLAPNAQGQFKINKRGVMAIGASYAAITALLPLARDSMGEDPETGVSRYDMLPLGEAQRYLPIGFGDSGEYAKFPLGFGPSRIAATAAICMDRVNRGLITTEDFAREMIFSVIKEVNPANWPEFSFKEHPLEWIEQAFSPALLRPVADVVTNTNFRGNRIVFDRSDNTAAAYAGRLSTPAVYHKFAEDVYKNFGINLAPEQWRTLYDGYAVGPLRLLKGLISESGDLRAGGAERNATETLGPALAALGSTMYYGKSHNLGRAMFYDELTRYNERAQRDGIKLTNDSLGRDNAKREAYQRRQMLENGWTDQEADEYLALLAASKSIKQLNKTWKKNKLPERWFDDEEGVAQMQSDFEELAMQQAAIYSRVAQNLSRYNGAKL